MRKTFRNIVAVLLCTATCVGFSACSDDDDKAPVITDPEPEPEPGDDVPELTTDISVEGYYKGDIYDNNTGNLWLNFISKDLVWDDFEEEYTGKGVLVCLDFNTVPASNPDLAELADGTYTAADTHAVYTLNTGLEDSYVVRYDGASPDQQDIVSGSVKVEKINNYTHIVADVTLADGDDFEFEYYGLVKAYNRSGEGQFSNLTGNVAMTDLTQGIAMYAGEAFTETSDHYMLVIAGEDYDLEENYGSSPSIMIGLNVAPGSNDGIPSGTYQLVDAMSAEDYEVGTALSGVYEPTYGGFFGTWYFATSDMLEAAMQTGNIVVVNNGDGSYVITFDMADGYGHTVKGTYTGKLEFADIS